MRIPASLALLAVLALPTAAGAAGVEALQGFYERVDTLSATFRQVQTDESGEALQRSSGTFLLARPDRFRWEYESPYRQIIVSDGETFSFYDVDLAQVTLRDVDESLQATPARLLAGGAALEEAFQVRDLGRLEDGLMWVRLIPRGDDGDFDSIRIGLDGNVPVRMELDDKLGQTTLIRFDDVQINELIAAERFVPDIPEDVTVVDGREAP